MLEVGQGLKMEVAVRFMLRIMLIADVVVFASSQNFAELENDKNMANGAILRQCLRLGEAESNISLRGTGQLEGVFFFSVDGFW